MAIVAEGVRSGLPSRTAATLRQISEMCWETGNAFLDWERANVLKANPSAESLEKHRQDLKWLLRTVKLLHAMTSDPEFPEPSLGNDFKLLLDRLNRSWQLVHEPGMSEEEANGILRECFPNGPGA